MDMSLEDFNTINDILKKYEANTLYNTATLIKALRKMGFKNIALPKDKEPPLGNNGEPAIDEGEAQDKAEYSIGER